MANDNAVLHYTKGIAVINFPNGEVKCDMCPCMETYSRPQCRLTGEYLAKGYLRGWYCPLEIVDEDEIK